MKLLRNAELEHCYCKGRLAVVQDEELPDCWSVCCERCGWEISVLCYLPDAKAEEILLEFAAKVRREETGH